MIMKNKQFLLIFSIFTFTLFVFSSCKDFDEPPETGQSEDEEIIEPGYISALEPDNGSIWDTLTIRGENFGEYTESYDYVMIDTIMIDEFIKWEGDVIQLIVPEFIRFGANNVSVVIEDTTSNIAVYTLNQTQWPGSIEMIEIPAGSFKMGDINGSGFVNELPVHDVTISKAFYISKFEVSQAHWKALVATNPSTVRADSLPVNGISWHEAVAFCNALSKLEGLTPAYSGSGNDFKWDMEADGYRLPTEAEWEYACRAGTETDFYTGNTEADLANAAWYYGNIDFDEVSTTHPKGLKNNNSFGLYDMHGNVAEWCWDWWAEYSATAQTDPTGPETGWGRVIRGGAWNSKPDYCRSSFRFYYRPPADRIEFAGLRLARNK